MVEVRNPAPRLEPRLDEDMDESTRTLVEEALGPDAPPARNLIRTFAWNPGLLRRWIPFGGRLLGNGKLSPRMREICILRVASRCECDYEWSQHVLLGQEASLSIEEVQALNSDIGRAWSSTDGCLIDAVDELHESSSISNGTWAKLRENLSAEQLVELPILIGAYTCLAFFLNSLRVELEPDLEGFRRTAGK